VRYVNLDRICRPFEQDKSINNYEQSKKVPSLAKTIIYYFKNDILGMVDALHIATCDKRSAGDKNALMLC
jgi:hypothetical protein